MSIFRGRFHLPLRIYPQVRGLGFLSLLPQFHILLREITDNHSTIDFLDLFFEKNDLLLLGLDNPSSTLELLQNICIRQGCFCL